MANVALSRAVARDAAGNFGALINVRAGGFRIWGAVGDFDGDGVQDLATSNYETGDVSVLLRNCNHAPVLDPSKNPMLCREPKCRTSYRRGVTPIYPTGWTWPASDRRR